jgi:hypothetical protein
MSDHDPPRPRRSDRRHPPYEAPDNRKPKRTRAISRPPEYHAAHSLLSPDVPDCLPPPVLSIIVEFYMERPDLTSPFRSLPRRQAQLLSRANGFSVLQETTALDGPVSFPTHCHVPIFDMEHGSTYHLVTPVFAQQRAGTWWVRFRRVDQWHCSSLVMLARFKVPLLSADGGSLLNYIDVPRFRIRRMCQWVPPRLGRIVTCEAHSYPPQIDLATVCGVDWCQACVSSRYLISKYNARHVYMASAVRDDYSPHSVVDMCSDRAGGHEHDTATSHLLAKQSSFHHRGAGQPTAPGYAPP